MNVQVRTPQELEHYVILASNPTNGSSEMEVQAASSVLDSIRNDMPVNTAALQCIELIKCTGNVHAEFFAWSTLQLCLSPKITAANTSRGMVDKETRFKIRTLVMGAHNSQQIIPKQTFIRTQMGVVLALLIQLEFPEEWTNAFDEIIHILVVSTSVDGPEERFLKMDLFLRILDGVCDEIVENQESDIVHRRNTMIKDVMRGFIQPGSINTEGIDHANTIICKIVDTVLNIARHYIFLSQQNPSMGVQSNLAPFALSVFKRFIPWIDLSFIVNESVITLLYSCLIGSCTGDAEDDITTALAMQSIDCLNELISRGMVIGKKIHLLTEINLFSNLIQIETLESKTTGVNLNQDTDIYLAIKVAQLVNSTGAELIECWEKQSFDTGDVQNQEILKKTAILLHQFLPLFFHCFIYDDIDVTGAVLPVATNIIIALGKEIKQPTQKLELFSFSPYLNRFLTEIYNQMKYPEDFQFDQNSDEDAEEQIFRYDLRKLYIKVVRASPKDISLQFLCQIFANIPMPLSSAPPMPLEAALRLLFHYSEGIRPNASSVMKMEPFFELILALHQSDVSLHSLNEIVVLYFDIAVRYLDVFKTKPEFLPGILGAISGPRGLQHASSERVRSRSCYSLLRLVKGMSQDGRMKGYVDTAVGGIQGG